MPPPDVNDTLSRPEAASAESGGGPERCPYKKILVAIDASARFDVVLDEVGKVARKNGAQVTLMHVVDVLHYVTGFEKPGVFIREVLPSLFEAGEKTLSNAKAKLIQDGIVAHTVLEERHGARLADLVVARAIKEQADLIMLGTHARQGMQRLLEGSDAEAIVRRSPVPVLLVHTPV